jgi:hypothetical protein
MLNQPVGFALALLRVRECWLGSLDRHSCFSMLIIGCAATIHGFFHAGLNGTTPASRLNLRFPGVATDITSCFRSGLWREEYT